MLPCQGFNGVASTTHLSSGRSSSWRLQADPMFELVGKTHQLGGFWCRSWDLETIFALAVDDGFVFRTPAKQTNRLKISWSHLGTSKNHFFDGWKWWFPTISHVKIWFIIQFRVPGLYSFRFFHVDEFAKNIGKKTPTGPRTTCQRSRHCFARHIAGEPSRVVLPGLLAGGFKHFLFPPLPGEMIQID